MATAHHPHAKLICSADAFDGIHEALDRVRATSSTVKVDRAALQALLIDHCKLIKMQERRA